MPPPHYNAIASKYDEPVCESEGGNHKSLTLNLSADDDKRDQQDNEAEMADEERFSGDRDQDTPPFPYSTEMRPLSTAGEKAHMKPPIKRRHLSSAALSKSQAPPRTDLYDGCRTASLGTGSLNSVANTPCPLEPYQGQAYPTHEDEEWEIVRILRKRQIGKSYEYKIQWRNTWLPKSALGNAQALLKDFEAKSQAKSQAKRGRRRGRGARMDEGQ